MTFQRLGCTLPNRAKFCFRKSTAAEFHSLTVTDNDFTEKKRKDMASGPSIVFTKKTVDETFVQDSTRWFKSIVGIDASRPYPFSMFLAMPTGPYTRWEPYLQSGKFKQRQNKTRIFESNVMSYFQRVRPQCKVESFYTTGKQKKLDAYSIHGLCGHCSAVFEAMECYYQYCLRQEARSTLTEQVFWRDIRKRELDELRKQYIQGK